jgi:hypothetical protein
MPVMMRVIMLIMPIMMRVIILIMMRAIMHLRLSYRFTRLRRLRLRKG